MRLVHRRFLLTAALAATTVAQGAVQDAPTSGALPDTPVQAGEVADRLDEPTSEPFRLSISPYVWVTSYSGDLGVKGVEIGLDVGFDDIIDSTDTVLGFMGAIELQYGRLIFQVNGAWSYAESSQARGFARNGTLDADVELSITWGELIGGYRLLDLAIADGEEKSARRLTIDGLVGARYTSIDADTKLTARVDLTLPDGTMISAGQTVSRDQRKDWVEPLVGARLGLDLTESCSLSLRGDIGGFGVSGSDFAWQVAALFGYRWHLDGWWVSVFGGYRALSQDYSSGAFDWDVVTHGPLFGAQFLWTF